jgi:hypothetical protein
MSTDDRIPDLLYDENDQLGKSDRSVVYSGLYRRQMVAIKKAEKRKGDHLDQELLQQLRQLKHANVMQIFHVDATDSFWWDTFYFIATIYYKFWNVAKAQCIGKIHFVVE